MIVEELIMFERAELNYNQSFDTQLLLTKIYLSKFPPLSRDKLKLFIDMLKENQNQLSYKGYSAAALIFLLLGFILIFQVSVSATAVFGFETAYLNLIEILLTGSLFATIYIIRRKRKPKHQLILQVLEYLFFEK